MSQHRIVADGEAWNLPLEASADGIEQEIADRLGIPHDCVTILGKPNGPWSEDGALHLPISIRTEPVLEGA